MTEYLLQHGTRETPQSEPMRGDQVPNSAGGFAWGLDNWARLRRFLILGSEGGTYYIGERDLTRENVQCIRACLAEDGPRTVAEIVAVSHGGRASKNDPALYALATAISLGDNPTKRAAAEALPSVARIGTHLYHFVAYAETMRGWGRTMRWAIQNWYDRNPEQLALQAVKYRQRDGWTHRDLLRLAHPPKGSGEQAALFEWICRPDGAAPAHEVLTGYQLLLDPLDLSPQKVAAVVRHHNLPRETVPSEWLTSPDVWEALLENMPMTAMIRNLATMTRVGLIAPGSDATKKVLTELALPKRLEEARIHPISVLAALCTYQAGHGMRGQNTWKPVTQIVDALDAAFYLTFGNVTPTGKRYMLALDVSSSMQSGYVGGIMGLHPNRAAAAMALVTANTEANYEAVAFQRGIEPITLSPRQRIDDVMRIPWHGGGTDCAQPMLYAMANERVVDAFVVYTDSETWAGQIHPVQALRQYRERHNPFAQLIVVGMTSNGFTIADPNDAGMLDVVGFDTATPQLMSEFVSGAV